jgi:hypothetical protein
METIADSFPLTTFTVFARGALAAAVACCALDLATTPPVAATATRTAAPASNHRFRITGPP